MKKLIFLFCGFFIWQSALSQTRTENVRNQIKNSTGTASTDSLSTTSGAVSYLVSVTVNTAIASDSIYVKQGAGQIAKIIFGATPPGPFTLFFNTRIDSSYVTIQRLKTSDVTATFRTTGY